MPARTTLRWRHDMLVLDHTVVGSVEDHGHDGWWAYGCMDEWEDADLGLYDKKEDAKRAVERWVEDNRED